MTQPKWLSRDDVVDLQTIAIEKDGGLSGGLTRPDLLDSALGRPQNEFAYTGQDDVFVLAAIYAEGIAKNHAFADANKRTGFLAADVFLYQNGFDLQKAKGTEHADMMVDFVNDKISREDAAAHLKAHSQQIEQEHSQQDFFRDFLERSRREEQSQSHEHSIEQDDDPEI